MGETESAQDMVVKEVAERPMANVMEQTGKTQQFLYVEPCGDPILKDTLHERIEVLRECSRHMHGAEGMLKPAMFG
jgi:hypothetical protein